MVGAVAQFHFDPAHYLELMHDEVPRYVELQEETARATDGVTARTILELGVGTGETARRVLARHPGATLVGIDASAEMLAAASLPGADLRVGRLEDPLPEGPFDLVVSCLAVHHLDGGGKRGPLRPRRGGGRGGRTLRPGGRGPRGGGPRRRGDVGSGRPRRRSRYTPLALTTKSVAKPSRSPARTSQVTTVAWPYFRFTANSSCTT
jgi:SAM-dependent methyltransferase